ncbi:hypothetical protein ACN27E_00370 [Mycobacterium sp. WMMD1722]|uniref:hypothetical protein n=1 Tax=Mycobacterium sp. WMMD1722 TaxID=3404117 RepID=UPI003BF563D6
MRYRFDVVSPSVADAVTFAGGWLFDRAMAGWDVTVLIPASGDDIRPLEILGACVLDLETVLESWAERPHPQTVSVSAHLFENDERVRRHVRNALDHGLTEVTLWGDPCPPELDRDVDAVHHELSAAARAFKSQALAAVGRHDPTADRAVEIFRCGMMTRRSVATDLVPAS